MVSTVVALALAGVVIGILSGLLGIGGGTLIIPLLRLGFGFDALLSVGTSLFTIIPTSISGVIGHLRDHSVEIRLGLLFGVFGALFSPLGSYCSKLAGGMVVMVCAGIVIVYTAWKMIRKALSMPRTAHAPGADTGSATCATCGTELAADRSEDTHDVLDLPADEPIGRTDGQSTAERQGMKGGSDGYAPIAITGKVFLEAAAAGMATGFVSGFIGVGGGFIIVPLSMWLFGLDMKRAAGTSLVAVSILAIPGAITHGMLGDVAWIEGIALAVGSIPGALMGSALSRRIPDRTLRLVFGVLLIIAGLALVVKEFV